MHRLWGMRAYLAGPIDRVADGGVVWRQQLVSELEQLGVVALDPCNKPIDIGQERAEDRVLRRQIKEAGDYDELAMLTKRLRIVDLRMVDMADFLVVYINTDVHMCGTYEELHWANRLKRPILVMCEQGKGGVPDWLFGVIPHQHMFSSWGDLLDYLRHVDESEDPDPYRRWLFFDYSLMQPLPPSSQSVKKIFYEPDNPDERVMIVE